MPLSDRDFPRIPWIKGISHGLIIKDYMDFEGLFLAEAQINADADSTNALCAEGFHRLLAHSLLNINLLNP